jgi:hypothetical protein
MPSRSLPDDIESLQRLVIEQRAALLSRDVEIEKLKIELARLKRMQELKAPLVNLPAVEKARPARRPLPVNRIEELLPWRVDLHTDLANRLAA